MDSSSGSGGARSSSSGSAPGALASFIKLGFIGVIIFAFCHLFSCYILAWVIGQEFSTVVYVTAASVVTGTLVVFTIAFLVALNIVLTAVTGLSQGAMNLFEGVGGGPLGGSQRQSRNSSRSHISDLVDEDLDPNSEDADGIKLD